MRHIHLDPLGGIAGDMFVAALLDAFPDLRDRVFADVAAVLPPEAGRMVLEPGLSGGIRVVRLGLAGGTAGPPGSHFTDLLARIRAARLAAGTAEAAAGILTVLAEAEADIHGVPVGRVHFHEIADWDSLLDMVAAGSIAAALAGARWSVAPLPRGDGVVRTAHGLLPVPGPATVRILGGYRWRDDGVPGERVTPTGAAILRYLGADPDASPAGRLVAAGAGGGTRDLPGMPNLLRVLVFDAVRPPARDRVTVIAFEVDDMTGEEIGLAADRLRAEPGVLDVSLAERWGKKGRPMQSFQVLARPADADRIAGRCFAETSTIGLRVGEEERIVLQRDSASVGGIGVKLVDRPGVGRTAKAESDAVAGDSLAARRSARTKAESGAE